MSQNSSLPPLTFPPSPISPRFLLPSLFFSNKQTRRDTGDRNITLKIVIKLNLWLFQTLLFRPQACPKMYHIADSFKSFTRTDKIRYWYRCQCQCQYRYMIRQYRYNISSIPLKAHFQRFWQVWGRNPFNKTSRYCTQENNHNLAFKKILFSFRSSRLSKKLEIKSFAIQNI